jgi:hypothetical protein
VPVTYLAARPVELSPNWPVKQMQAFIRTKQVQFTETVPNGRLVEVQSSHDIDLDKPELVIKEINRILEMAWRADGAVFQTFSGKRVAGRRPRVRVASALGGLPS